MSFQQIRKPVEATKLKNFSKNKSHNKLQNKYFSNYNHDITKFNFSNIMVFDNDEEMLSYSFFTNGNTRAGSSNANPKETPNIKSEVIFNDLNHPLEIEADVVAENIMNVSDNDLTFDNKQTNINKHTLVPLRSKSLNINQMKADRGYPIDYSTKEFMESRFGFEFSNIRIHHDMNSDHLSNSINARAFTLGNDIFLSSDESKSDKKLLAHELTHVIQQNLLSENISLIQRQGKHRPKKGSKKVTRPDPEAIMKPDTETIMKDYIDAHNYVTDFYTAYTNMHTSLVRAAHRAIDQFTAHSSIKDPANSLGGNIAFQLIYFTLAILPGAAIVKEGFEKVTKAAQLAMNGDRLATIVGKGAERIASGIYEAAKPQAPSGAGEHGAAGAALTDLSTLDTQGTAKIEKERDRVRSYVTELKGIDASKLKQVDFFLGPKPVYNPDVIKLFERDYELGLYRNYYRVNSFIDASTCGMFYAKTHYEPAGIPLAVQDRVLHLSGYQHLVNTKIGRDNILKVMRNWGVKERTQPCPISMFPSGI